MAYTPTSFKIKANNKGDVLNIQVGNTWRGFFFFFEQIIVRVFFLTNKHGRGGDDGYLALEVVAVPLGAVVDPLPLVVDEHHVARIAGRRRHPRLPLVSISLLLASICFGGHGRATLKGASLRSSTSGKF